MTGTIKHFIDGKRKSIKRYTSKEEREKIIASYNKTGYYDILPDEQMIERPKAEYTNKDHWTYSKNTN